ncbi:hybrid signal transduction histidine kinase G-like [Leptopilina heterotoma]|uniref:hybrid signal transduction histidine kinase G-like n=1 Tax=Leptopilina heterotoma TaxID=63436 RepID=UPI001CAA0C79|nr:hybrid signal transduction histidine kinase G-like [Leptopilina heterotoma]
MNNQKSPVRRYSLRKRLKTEGVQKNDPVSCKEKNLRKLKAMLKFFTDKKQDLIAELKLNDCIRLMMLETQITEILDFSQFQGAGDKNGTIGDKLLHEAIEKKNLSLLKKLIKNQVLQKSICHHELTPLMELIAKGRSEWIDLFYKAGYSFKGEKTKSGLPILHFALQQEFISKELIKKLLSYGVELSSTDSNDLTPLHFLLSNQVNLPNYGKMEFVKLFLKFGANPNSSSKLTGETPLHTAVRNRNCYAVIHLLLYNANVNVKNVNNDTAFHLIADRLERKFSKLTVQEDKISLAFVKHIYWMKLNSKEIDKQITSHRNGKIFKHNKHTKITSKNNDEQHLNVISILTKSENQLMRIFNQNSLNISSVIERSPYCYWKRHFKFRIKTAKLRFILMNKCEMEFMKFTHLPSIFVQMVLKKLSTVELRSLFAALCPKSFMEKIKIESIKLTEDEDDYEMSSTANYSTDENDNGHDNDDDDGEDDDDDDDEDMDDDDDDEDDDDDDNENYFDVDDDDDEVDYRIRMLMIL